MFYYFFRILNLRLRVALGPRVKLASSKSALNPPVVYSTEHSKGVVLVLVLLFVASWFILPGYLFYVLPCVILFLCFSVLLALQLPCLGKRKLILVLFVRLFNLCLFGFVGFLFFLVSGKDCGLRLCTHWTFLLPFFFLSHFSPSVYLYTVSTCYGHNSSYSFVLIILKLCMCFFRIWRCACGSDIIVRSFFVTFFLHCGLSHFSPLYIDSWYFYFTEVWSLFHFKCSVIPSCLADNSYEFPSLFFFETFRMSFATIMLCPLSLSTLGKIFSRRHIKIFSCKTGFDISCKLHGMSNNVFCEK